jgi:hypothetical protein
MTPREICEKIVERNGCFDAIGAQNCQKCFLNKYCCDYPQTEAAQQWLADNPKPILKDGEIHYSPEDLKRMSEGLERINEDNNMGKYVEVDSRKEIVSLINKGERIFQMQYSGGYRQMIVCTVEEFDISETTYKINPEYCEYKEGQLVWSYGTLTRYSEKIKNETLKRISEAELRTLVPQLFEQFVKDIRKFLEKDTMCDVDLYIKDLINKYKGE